MDTQGKLLYINTKQIVANPNQPRKSFDLKSIEELAQSIDVQGLIQPILVRDITKASDTEKVYELVAGERRLRAIRDILGLDRIKAIVQVMSEAQSEEAALIENIQRQNLNAIEEAHAILNLMVKEDLTQEQMAKRLGKSRADIGNITRLLKLGEPVQQLLISGLISRTIGFRLASRENVDEQSAWANKIIKNSWNYDQFRRAIDVRTETTTKEKGKRKSKNLISKQEQTKNLALVEFEDHEALQEFLAYMLEQGFKCVSGVEIFDLLDNRLLKSSTVEPITTTIIPEEPVDLLEENDENECIINDDD